MRVPERSDRQEQRRVRRYEDAATRAWRHPPRRRRPRGRRRLTRRTRHPSRRRPRRRARPPNRPRRRRRRHPPSPPPPAAPPPLQIVTPSVTRYLDTNTDEYAFTSDATALTRYEFVGDGKCLNADGDTPVYWSVFYRERQNLVSNQINSFGYTREDVAKRCAEWKFCSGFAWHTGAATGFDAYLDTPDSNLPGDLMGTMQPFIYFTSDEDLIQFLADLSSQARSAL